MKFFFCLLLLPITGLAQSVLVKQRALNSYVDYANQSSKEISTVVESFKTYYTSWAQQRTWTSPRFTCPVQPDSYYFQNALTLGKEFPDLNKKLNSVKVLADSIDSACKALDTYYKLEDFKQDNHGRGGQIVRLIPSLLERHQKKIRELEGALESAAKTLNNSAQAVYVKTDQEMRKQIVKERAFIDLWNLNFDENIHTGWADEAVLASIQQTDDELQHFNSLKPALKYPASSMWSSFQESLGNILTEKRRALDEYNFEAKKSDKHSNNVYLDLINYFNGTLVSDYNTFIQFSERDGYFGLKFIQYYPLFNFRTQAKSFGVSVQPFTDKNFSPLAITEQKAPILRAEHESLSAYIDFMNESWRQVRTMHMVLNSFLSSATHFKDLDSYEKHGQLHFDYQNFHLPLSQYQTAIARSKNFPASISQTLNGQAEVLLDILKEMDGHAAAIDISVKTRQYEEDHLARIFEHLQREKELINIWDEKKEKLDNDIRNVYHSFPQINKTNSWYKSGSALQALTDFDRDALFLAKLYYRGDTSIVINTLNIDNTIRDVLSKEYDNMKGIEKLGRYNGNCPYTPYEDIPSASRTLSEKFTKLKNSKSSYNRHPYEGLVYLYNEIVDDYNSFCELSKDVLLLKTVLQPELFFETFPEPSQGTTVTGKAIDKKPAAVEVKKEPAITPVASNSVMLIRDTVIIEKHDTIYLTDPSDDVRSMEGYAANNLVLLLDVSGSMNSPEKLPLLKQSVLNMLNMMRKEDEVSIVIFSGKASTLLKPVSFKEEDKIRKAINNLRSEGKTDANAGLKLAYKVADDNYKRGGNNRIILATDGEFPMSDASRELISKFASQDIFLTVFDFGKTGTRTAQLEELATLGRGNFTFISKENIENKLIREAKSKKKR